MSETRTPIDILKAARKRIEEPKNWCQNSAYGKYVGNKPTAWCALGSIWEEVGSDSELSTICEKMLIKCLPEGLQYSLPTFNDYHKHEEVLALFDRAIGDR